MGIQKTTYFDFLGITVQVETNSDEINKRIQTDFSHFSCKQASPLYTIKLFLDEIPDRIPEKMVASNISENSVTYNDKEIRFNDYFGKALSIYNYKKEIGEVYSPNIHKLHEVSYLLILSRVGKRLDLNGFHKIHAFGISHKGINLIGMMPMKGGKSTLFLNLIENRQVDIISDDTPIIDYKGNVHPFPLRIGINNPSNFKNVTTLEREKYGTKYLIPLQELPNSISQCKGQTILFEGIRVSGDHFSIKRYSKLSLISPLVKHMVVGVGLPIIIEYFLENSLKDWCRRLIILTKRLQAAILLLIRCKTYKIYLGENTVKNSQEIRKFFNIT